jgi:hypothetical protein
MCDSVKVSQNFIPQFCTNEYMFKLIIELISSYLASKQLTTTIECLKKEIGLFFKFDSFTELIFFFSSDSIKIPSPKDQYTLDDSTELEGFTFTNLITLKLINFSTFTELMIDSLLKELSAPNSTLPIVRSYNQFLSKPPSKRRQTDISALMGIIGSKSNTSNASNVSKDNLPWPELLPSLWSDSELGYTTVPVNGIYTHTLFLFKF